MESHLIDCPGTENLPKYEAQYTLKSLSLPVFHLLAVVTLTPLFPYKPQMFLKSPFLFAHDATVYATI